MRIDRRPTRMLRLPDQPQTTEPQTTETAERARRRADYVVTLLTEGHDLTGARRLTADPDLPACAPPEDP